MAKQFYIWLIEKYQIWLGCFGLFKSPNGKPTNNPTHTLIQNYKTLLSTSSISQAVMIYKMCTLRGINLLTRLQKNFYV